MEIFFSKRIDGDIALFDENESAHCVKVLRYKNGDEVSFVDGKGYMYRGLIMEASSRACSVKILSAERGERGRDYSLHIALSPLKSGERFEWFLEKATEIGIDEITPIFTAHSDKRGFNSKRGERVILSAMKQSLKSHLPKLNPSSGFNSFIGGLSNYHGIKIIAHCNEGERKPLAELVSQLKREGERDFLILIGPEGDFSPEEASFAESCGFHSVTLGKSRLRSETAAIVALLTLYITNG